MKDTLKQILVRNSIADAVIDEMAAKQCFTVEDFANWVDKREDLNRASMLFGSMDGAMKFVKGDAIAGLDMPTLFVSGALDAIGGPPAMMQGMCDQVPGARHVTLADAGHICNMANPEAYSAAVLEFLKEGV